MNSFPALEILILEDQGLVRAGMRELLKISVPNANIHEASSYDEAISILGLISIGIAFLDFDLKSARSGYDVLLHIRENDMETRVVMLSARAERELVVACIHAGAAGYIPKDMNDSNVFRLALDTVFQGGIFLPKHISDSETYAPHSIITRNLVTPESLGISGKSLEVLCYLCQGLSNKSIARKMNVEEGTIRKDYVPKLFRIFKVARRTELLIQVSRIGVKLPFVEEFC